MTLGDNLSSAVVPVPAVILAAAVIGAKAGTSTPRPFHGARVLPAVLPRSSRKARVCQGPACAGMTVEWTSRSALTTSE